MSRSLRVVRTGPAALIQDLGRRGWLSSGVGVSGAADPQSLQLANQLVGNDDGAAGVECLLGGLVLDALSPVTVAVAGAPVPVTVDDRPVDHGAAVEVPAGARLALGMADAGLRAYVAVAGGIEVPEVLGSRSTDTLAGIGPARLQPDVVLPVGDPSQPATSDLPADRRPITNDPLVLRIEPGPRQDWFTDPDALFRGSWITSDDVDRVGARLTRKPGGPALTRAHDRELPTEGMALGAIQVPPNGEPVVFLADHPVTGGYPVIGCVLTEDVGRMAQARPGQEIIFRPAGAAPSVPLGEPSVRIAGDPTADELAAVVAVLASVTVGTPGGCSETFSSSA